MATHFTFLPEKSYGQRSLVGYSPKSSKELDTTEPRAHDKTYIKMVWFCYMLYMFLYILHYILLKILVWFYPETMITDLADPGPCLSIFLPSPPHSWCPSVSAALRENTLCAPLQDDFFVLGPYFLSFPAPAIWIWLLCGGVFQKGLKKHARKPRLTRLSTECSQEPTSIWATFFTVSNSSTILLPTRMIDWIFQFSTAWYLFRPV